MKKQLLILGLIASLGACGGSDDNNNTGSSSTGTNASGNNGNNGSGGSPGGSSGQGGNATGGSGSSAQPTSPATPGATGGTPPPGPTLLGSTELLVNAYQSGLAEIQMSQFAAQNAATPQVREFAQRMIADHTALNAEIARVAGANVLTLPAAPSAQQQAQLASLQGQAGIAIDRAYMQANVAMHDTDAAQMRLQMLRGVGLNGQGGASGGGAGSGTGTGSGPGAGTVTPTAAGIDTDVARLASVAYPAFKLHLALAESVAGLVDPAAFLATAQQDSAFEIQAGQLALRNSSNAAVRTFAQRMIDAHTALTAQVAPVAQQKGVTLPASLSTEQQLALADLARFTGADFDKAYMDVNVTGHAKDVQAFTLQAQAGTDPDVKALAAAALPELQSHLDQATAIDAQVVPSVLYGALQGALAETQLAQLALMRSQNAGVLAFAANVLASPAANGTAVATLGQQQNIALPTEPSPAQLAAVAQLLGTASNAFNASLLSAFITTVNTGQANLDAALGTTTNTAVQGFGRELSTGLGAQLTQAQALLSGL